MQLLCIRSVRLRKIATSYHYFFWRCALLTKVENYRDDGCRGLELLNNAFA